MLRSKKVNKNKIWGARYTDASSKEMLKLNSSIHFDKKLYQIIGNQEIECYINNWTILSLNKVFNF